MCGTRGTLHDFCGRNLLRDALLHLFRIGLSGCFSCYSSPHMTNSTQYMLVVFFCFALEMQMETLQCNVIYSTKKLHLNTYIHSINKILLKSEKFSLK